MNNHVWGNEQTKYFYSLTPDKILKAVEQAGFHCTGRLTALNSMENRVYEIEIERSTPSNNPSDHFVVAKFYRPGRWSKEQIIEEHTFLNDLAQNDIPVIAPLPFADGSTLHELSECHIYYCLFPKRGGRSTDELDQDKIKRLGRLVARVHNCGQTKNNQHRINLNLSTYGDANLQYLIDEDKIPEKYESEYIDLVEEICELSDPLFAKAATQRIHGDCHLANILWRPEGPLLLDFDDMVNGPPVQDMWLIIPGRDSESLKQRELFIEAYEELREFDRSTVHLIEPLRALRFVHFSAWMSKRWQDPAFPKAFPHFGSEKYWQEQVDDLREQLGLIKGP